ncbi:MAG: NUDIX domain-containing protein [Bacilli bacterium]|nr:NUDIX domain-containing protein [Bacilli bacterium]
MAEYKEHKHLGVYGLIIKDNKILLIKKVTGPYDGKLDLPGGTIEYCEKPEDTLKRELMEEVGIEIKDYEIYDADSVTVEWAYQGIPTRTHHIGIFYIIKEFTNEIRKDIKIDSQNDDSLGAEFYDIKNLTKDMLSNIAILELEKLGYKLY